MLKLNLDAEDAATLVTILNLYIESNEEKLPRLTIPEAKEACESMLGSARRLKATIREADRAVHNR